MTHYKLFNSGDRKAIPMLTEIPAFHELGYYPDNYGIYATDPRTRKLPYPITLDWVTAEQIRCLIPVHPFTHRTLGLESDQLYRPPFHVQVICPFNFRSDILDSVWLLNDVDINPTRELDLFESGRSWRKRLWFADHFGGPKYADRRMYSTEILFPKNGVHQVDMYVYPNYMERYLDGRLVSVMTADLNYDYRIRCTLIVNTPDAGDCDWDPEIFVR